MAKNLWKSPQIHPSLAYEDVPNAVEWLSRVFGFRECKSARLTAAGFVLAWMEYGDGLIGLTTGSPEAQSPKKLGKVTQSVKVYVDNIDQHFQHAKAAGGYHHIGACGRVLGRSLLPGDGLRGALLGVLTTWEGAGRTRMEAAAWHQTWGIGSQEDACSRRRSDEGKTGHARRPLHFSKPAAAR